MNIPFKSTLNTRSIIDGSLKFIRSDVPTSLTEEETAFLADNGITTLVDLRTADEQAAKPCPLMTDNRFDYFTVSISGGNSVPISPDEVALSYIAMVDAQMSEAVDIILSAESNVLYFCNAGKDRTGVVSAIILHFLGYSNEYIIDDYMKSKENLAPMLAAYIKSNPEANAEVITPNERYMREFLKWLKDNIE